MVSRVVRKGPVPIWGDRALTLYRCLPMGFAWERISLASSSSGAISNRPVAEPNAFFRFVPAATAASSRDSPARSPATIWARFAADRAAATAPPFRDPANDRPFGFGGGINAGSTPVSTPARSSRIDGHRLRRICNNDPAVMPVNSARSAHGAPDAHHASNTAKDGPESTRLNFLAGTCTGALTGAGSGSPVPRHLTMPRLSVYLVNPTNPPTHAPAPPRPRGPGHAGHHPPHGST